MRKQVLPKRRALIGLGALLSVSLAVTAAGSAASAAPGDPLFLGDASSFSVLAHTTVTNSGAATLLDRDLGADIALTTPGLLPGMVLGATHLSDALALSAQTAATAAANDLMAAPTYVVGAPDLAGSTFVAGSYSSATDLNNTGVMTLQGDADDVFIFTAVADITLGGSSSMVFTGGAQACNVFWRAGAAATIGVGAAFAGTVIAGTSVNVNTDATIDGRLIAQTGQVSLLNNVFTSTPCISAGDGDSLGGTTGPTAPTLSLPPVVPAVPVVPVVPVAPVVPAVPAVPADGNTTLAATGAELAATGVDVTRPALAAVFVALLGLIMVTGTRLRVARRRS
jgi:hypothetical protein